MTGAPHPAPADPAASLRGRYGYLPAVLVTVLEAAGEDAMLRLVSTCGGTRITIPSDARVAGSALARAVGDLGAARAIATALRGAGYHEIAVPMMAHALAQARARRIAALRAEGRSVSQIARQIGMTERGVWAALARLRQGPDRRQMDLFASRP